MVHNHPKHPGYVLHQMMFLTFGFHGLLEGTLVPKHFVIDPSSRNWWIIPQFYLLGWGWEFRHKSTTLIEGVFLVEISPLHKIIYEWSFLQASLKLRQVPISSGTRMHVTRAFSILWPMGRCGQPAFLRVWKVELGEKELMTVKVTPLSTFFFSELLTVTAPLLSYGA